MRHVLQPAVGFFCLFHAVFAQANILPPNKLHLEDRLERMANLTEDEFNKIINDVVEQYKPLAANHGALLSSKNLWTNSTVNASAEQLEGGRRWIVNMYGGLARRPEVTNDGFALVVCHELGHHFAGFAFYDDTDWASSEGQSDYFSTQSCARKIWASQTAENAKFRAAAKPLVKTRCNAAWKTEAEQNICYRSAAAGESLATLLAAIGESGVPKFETPSLKSVTTTFPKHPAAQCRLDTYLAGALCSRTFDPGRIPARNHRKGQVSPEAEISASRSSCMLANGLVVGTRPRCWYGPKVIFPSMVRASESIKEKTGNGNKLWEPGETAEVNFSLVNKGTKATKNARGWLYSQTKGVTVDGKPQAFPDMEPGKTVANATPFLVQATKNLPCGQKVNLTMRARSNRGFAEFPMSLILGRIQSTNIGSQQIDREIPDNDPHGVLGVFESEVDVNISRLLVKLSLTHAFPTDLKIAVRFPDNTQRLIWNRGPGKSGENLAEPLELDVRSMSSKGIWGIKVVDAARNDVGKILKWEVVGETPVCDAPTPTPVPSPIATAAPAPTPAPLPKQ